MTRMFCSPSKYIQGWGVLEEINKYAGILGGNPRIIAGNSAYNLLSETLRTAFAEAGMQYDIQKVTGECCEETISGICDEIDAKENDVIIGLGAGKTIDMAKAVSHYKDLPLIIAPTAASSDAPCSSLSVLYTPDGVFDKYLFLKKNADIILVDSEVIAKAPVRLFVAGMGDALATYFEARAVQRSGAKNQVHELPTVAGYCLAEACYNNLLEKGIAARITLEGGACTKAVEDIIETNTFLSGIGFESGGLGAAHAIQKGFTVAEETHKYLHGEIVAFCLLIQLLLEEAPMNEIQTIIEFNRSVGLPICLLDLGIADRNRDQIMAIAEKACAPGSTIHNMPFEVCAEDVFNAILAADTMGRRYTQR